MLKGGWETLTTSSFKLNLPSIQSIPTSLSKKGHIQKGPQPVDQHLRLEAFQPKLDVSFPFGNRHTEPQKGVDSMMHLLECFMKLGMCVIKFGDPKKNYCKSFNPKLTSSGKKFMGYDQFGEDHLQPVHSPPLQNESLNQ